MISVTELLMAEGFIDSRWFDEYSRTRGSYVHQAIHLWDIGDLDEENLDPVIVPYLEAWKKFLKESKFEVHDSEVRLYSETYRFTGKPDKTGVLNGKPAILDLKSGSVQKWTAIQVAAYELLKGTPHKRLGLQLMDNGKYKLTEFKDRNDKNIFLAALSCYRWKINNGVLNNLKGGRTNGGE